MTTSVPNSGYFPAPAGHPLPAYRTYPEPEPVISTATRDFEPADPYALQPVMTTVVAPQPVVFVSPSPVIVPLSPAPPRPAVGLTRAIRLMFANMTNFSGRASRSEFWLPTFAILVAFIGWVITLTWMVTYLAGPLADLTLIGGAIAALLLVLPYSALMVRRLHDSNNAGTWWFLNLVPGIGNLIVAALCLQSSSPAAGHYDHPGHLPQQ